MEENCIKGDGLERPESPFTNYENTEYRIPGAGNWLIKYIDGREVIRHFEVGDTIEDTTGIEIVRPVICKEPQDGLKGDE